MHRGINPHRDLIRIFSCDLFINFKQIAVAFTDRIFAEPFNRVGEIQINAASARANTATFVADLFGGA